MPAPVAAPSVTRRPPRTSTDQPPVTYLLNAEAPHADRALEPLVLWDLALILPMPALDAELQRRVVAEAAGRPAGPRPGPPAEQPDPIGLRWWMTFAGLAATRLPQLLGRLPLVLLERGIAASDFAMPVEAAAEPVRLVAKRFPGVRQSVLSATVRPNARAKVRWAGLDDVIDDEAGAYGSDDVRWSTLLALAAQRHDGTRRPVPSRREIVVISHRPGLARAAGAWGATGIAVNRPDPRTPARAGELTGVWDLLRRELFGARRG